MRAKDIEVGKYYGFRPAYGSKLRRCLVLSVGEKLIRHQQKKGIEVQFDNGSIVVESGYYIVQPWDEYAREQEAKAKRIAEQEREYRKMDELHDRLRVALSIAGLPHVESVLYSRHMTLKVHCAADLERLCEILEEAELVEPPVSGITIDGANLHSSMRRFMDGPWSSALYNAIEICPTSTWEKILLAWSQIDDELSLRTRFNMIDWHVNGLWVSHHARMIKIGFDNLTDQEWEVLERLA